MKIKMTILITILFFSMTILSFVLGYNSSLKVHKYDQHRDTADWTFLYSEEMEPPYSNDWLYIILNSSSGKNYTPDLLISSSGKGAPFLGIARINCDTSKYSWAAVESGFETIESDIGNEYLDENTDKEILNLITKKICIGK